MGSLVAVVSGLALAWSTGVAGAGFELTARETARVHGGEVVIRADLDVAQRRGTVHAAMLVDAPPDVVFQAMSRCEEALRYVPHLRTCRVRSQSADGRQRLVEQEVDLGWFTPRLKYTFRADLVTDRSIAFRQVSGDFNVNEGLWEFEPAAGGTLLRYRVTIDPPGYVPNWVARSTLHRSLPRMMADLRRHCEAEQVLRAQANIPAY
jgi:ribosome-associated toxin RatA of RatAB toxin-antitoxin module